MVVGPADRLSLPQAAAQTVLSVLNGRSPGPRRAGAVNGKLLLTKHPRRRVPAIAAQAAIPLALVPFEELPVVPCGPIAPPVPSEAEVAELPETDTFVAGGAPVFYLGGGPAFVGGIGGGGGGEIVTPPGGGTVITPPPPLSAVPEPSLWLTMIVGMGLIGGEIRLRRRVARRAAA